MKKVENLGRTLTKEEQKRIKGGPVEGPKCAKEVGSACQTDSECDGGNQYNCACGRTSVDPVVKCYWLG